MNIFETSLRQMRDKSSLVMGGRSGYLRPRSLQKEPAMIPNLAQIGRTLGLAAALLLLLKFDLISVGAETGIVHHFEIETPATLLINEPAPIRVTARNEDGTMNRSAVMTLKIQRTTARGTRTTEASMTRGAAEMDLTFDELGLVILQVTDKADASLTNSNIVHILPQPVMAPR